jgi:hypothetical protein
MMNSSMNTLMSVYMNGSDDFVLNQVFLSADSLILTPEQICWATELSQAAPTNQHWQVYLNALALLGATRWFQERAPELSIDSEWLSPSHLLDSRVDWDQQDTLAQSLGSLTVGGFRLHLVTTDNPTDNLVPVSRAVIAQPDSMPHFYLMVEVLEELAQVRISGYLPSQQLVERCQVATLELEDTETCLIPIDWFDADSGRLLLYLSCLKSEPVDVAAAHRGVFPVQRAVNAGLWLRNQLDQVAESLAWVLLPPSPSLAMRSVRFSSDQLDRVMTDLIDRGDIELPPQIGHAYQEIPFKTTTLRLYALVWELPNAEDIPEWMLLVILGTPTGTQLPTEVRLQIRDATQLLADTVFDLYPDSYLYAQVSGRQDEQFYVTVSLEDEKIDLAPIGFSPAL